MVLFRFPSNKLFEISDRKIISSFKDRVTSQPGDDVTLLSPSDYEEADTCFFLHVNDMAWKGLTKVMICTVDTYVLNLEISLFDDLRLNELWMDFGSGEHRCFLPNHEMTRDPSKFAGFLWL